MFCLFVLTVVVSAVLVNGLDKLIFSEDFSKGIDHSLWKHEIVRLLNALFCGIDCCFYFANCCYLFVEVDNKFLSSPLVMQE